MLSGDILKPTVVFSEWKKKKSFEQPEVHIGISNTGSTYPKLQRAAVEFLCFCSVWLQW